MGFDAVMESGAVIELECGSATVGAPMATGGFSVVYSGFYGEIPAAVKVMTRKCGDFDKEVNLLLTLNHPNVCRFLGSVQTEKRQVLVTAKCVGDLLDSVAQQRPPLAQVKHLLREFYTGLEYLHSEGVAHLDLKLENLLLTDSGSVAICDFGFATRKKWSKQRVGTSGYVAPEIFYVDHLGDYDTFKADAWSASVVAFCLVVGYMPFESNFGRCPNYRLFRKHPAVFWAKVEEPETVDFLAWLLQFAPKNRREQVTRHPFF